MSRQTELIYVHDPMCSWCWGFRPAFEELVRRLPRDVPVRRLLGGLAPDSTQPMPAEMRRYLQQTWRHIQEQIPGTRFNFAFWQRCEPRRSTWPACRAVIAARSLEPDCELPMIASIQRAYYLDARNPSDSATLTELAADLGLPGERFATLLDAPATRQTLDAEISAARALGADSFPSLRLQVDGSTWPVTVSYTDPSAMLTAIDELMRT